MPSLKILRWLSWSVCILIACVFAIKDLKQLDFFWMLRTGDYIIHSKTIPSTDILSYTFQNTEWLNIKWLYEVLIYCISYIGGPEFIPVLQLMINIFIVVLIFKCSVLLKKLNGEKNIIIPSGGIILATLIYLLGTEFRMTGRPEMISHLMTLLFLHLYLSYKNNPSGAIYLLIPLQIIWTNCHDAFVNGYIMSIVFIISELAEYKIQRKEKDSNYKSSRHILIASALAVLSIGVNPNSYLLYSYPFKIFTSLNENNFTSEFFSCLNREYWMGKESYLLLVAFSLCMAGLLITFKAKDWKNRIVIACKTFGIPYSIFIILFFYLALSAERNVVYFMIISAPLVSFYIDYLIPKFKLNLKQKRIGYTAVCILGILFYVSICNNSYYKAFNIPSRYGFSRDKNDDPAGTVKFIKENNISGICFSDYLTSSVMLWHLRPDFKSYIDLRDLEVFTVPFFNEYQKMIRDTSTFINKDEIYKFDYALIYPNDFHSLHNYLYNSDRWVLAYIEPSCALYLKRNKKNETLINELEQLKDPDKFHIAENYKPSAAATFVSKLFWFPYKPETANINYNAFIKFYFRMVSGTKLSANNKIEEHKRIAQELIDKGEFNEAIRHLEEAIKIKEDIGTYLLLAKCAGAMHVQIPNDKLYMERWFDYMKNAYNLNNSDPRVRLMLGLAYCMDKRDYLSARKYLNDLENFKGITEDEAKLLKRCKELCNIQ